MATSESSTNLWERTKDHIRGLVSRKTGRTATAVVLAGTVAAGVAGCGETVASAEGTGTARPAATGEPIPSSSPSAEVTKSAETDPINPFAAQDALRDSPDLAESYKSLELKPAPGSKVTYGEVIDQFDESVNTFYTNIGPKRHANVLDEALQAAYDPSAPVDADVPIASQMITSMIQEDVSSLFSKTANGQATMTNWLEGSKELIEPAYEIRKTSTISGNNDMLDVYDPSVHMDDAKMSDNDLEATDIAPQKEGSSFRFQATFARESNYGEAMRVNDPTNTASQDTNTYDPVTVTLKFEDGAWRLVSVEDDN